MHSNIIYLVIFGVSALIPFLFFLIHKRFIHPINIQERSLLATNFGFFNALYAFLLGFAVVTLWASFNSAQSSVGSEAQAISSMYRIAIYLPGSEKLRDTIQEYTASILNDEWPAMDIEGRMCEKTQELYQTLWHRVHKYNPRSQKDWSFYNKLLDKLEDVSDFRVHRFLLQDTRLYPPLWFIIVVGAVFAVIGFYYMSAEKLYIQLIFDSIFIAMILLTIWLIVDLDKPFTGNLKVSGKPFEIIQTRMAVMSDHVKQMNSQDTEEESVKKKASKEEGQKPDSVTVPKIPPPDDMMKPSTSPPPE